MPTHPCSRTVAGPFMRCSHSRLSVGSKPGSCAPALLWASVLLLSCTPRPSVVFHALNVWLNVLRQVLSVGFSYFGFQSDGVCHHTPMITVNLSLSPRTPLISQAICRLQSTPDFSDSRTRQIKGLSTRFLSLPFISIKEV